MGTNKARGEGENRARGNGGNGKAHGDGNGDGKAHGDRELRKTLDFARRYGDRDALVKAAERRQMEEDLDRKYKDLRDRERWFDVRGNDLRLVYGKGIKGRVWKVRRWLGFWDWRVIVIWIGCGVFIGVVYIGIWQVIKGW